MQIILDDCYCDLEFMECVVDARESRLGFRQIDIAGLGFHGSGAKPELIMLSADS